MSLKQTGRGEAEVLGDVARRNVLGRIIDATEVAALVASLRWGPAIPINVGAIVSPAAARGSILC